MDADTLKKKLQKQNPVMMSPMAFALAACGGGGGGDTASNTSIVPTNRTTISSRELETNNTLQTANIASKKTFTGQTYSGDDKDYYYVEVGSWEVINVLFSSERDYYDHKVTVLDHKGIALAEKDIVKNGSITVDPYHDGPIYIAVTDGYNDDDDYTVTVAQSSGNYENEPNNFLEDADVLSPNISLTGQNFYLDKDYFKFVATSDVSSVRFTSLRDYYDHDVSILNSAGEVMTQEAIVLSDTVTTGTRVGETYYVLVENGLTDDSEYTVTLLEQDVSISAGQITFSEQDTPMTPNDYDWVVLDRSQDTFALHIENFEFFEKAADDIQSGSQRMQFFVDYGSTNSEDPSYQSIDYREYDWIDADNMTVTGEGLLKQIVVTDETISDVVVLNGYEYISFGILTDNVYVSEEFAVADLYIA